MKISSRELLLVWLTLVVLIFGLSYWFVQPRVRGWTELGKQHRLAEGRCALAKRLLEQKPSLDERMESLRKKVPSYPADKDVTSDYLKIIEQLAKNSNLSLIQRRPDREKLPKQGRLYELAVDCTWEGDLSALLGFLSALEAQEHIVMDVRDLAVSPVPGKQGRLKGSFALLCMYSRTSDSAKPAVAAQAAATVAPVSVQPQADPASAARLDLPPTPFVGSNALPVGQVSVPHVSNSLEAGQAPK